MLAAGGGETGQGLHRTMKSHDYKALVSLKLQLDLYDRPASKQNRGLSSMDQQAKQPAKQLKPKLERLRCNRVSMCLRCCSDDNFSRENQDYP